MKIDDIACMGSQRLRDLRKSKKTYGIDSVHFQRSAYGDPELLVVLTSYWTEKDSQRVAKNPDDTPIKLENIVIDGGRRIRDVQPVLVHKFENDESLGSIGTFRIRLNHAGDPSPYSLRLICSPYLPDEPPDGFDRRYVYAEFSFCAGGIADEDCSTEDCHPEENLPHPPIDYLAKDYSSFRKLMLDRLSQTVPHWTERCPADLGVTIVEALAYHADHLSYFQDAIGTEAYLQTARRRLSVRRHARLVDYRLHEGCNARAWVFVQVNQPIDVDPQWAFYTSPDTPFRSRANHAIHKKVDLLEPCEHDRLVYEPVISLAPKPTQSDRQKAKVETKLQRLHPANNLFQIYSWGNDECCLPKGSTSATLILSEKSTLSAGDLLMFQEVKGPNTGLVADANPAHRHMVRLNRVVETIDFQPGKETTEIKIAEVSWDTQDALPFAFCIS